MIFDTSDGDGKTRRQRNEKLGGAHMNKTVDLPPNGVHIWNLFWSLSCNRDSGENGPSRISPRDIMDWIALSGDLITRRECGMILAMDNVYRATMADEIRGNSARAAAQAKARGG